jgi:IS1 family transposase
MMVGVRAGRLELDEIWGYVGKKQKRVQRHEISHKDDQYTFIAMSASAKAIISYRTGKRDSENTDLFIQDLRERVIGAPEISTDGFHPYKNAIRDAFKGQASHGVIVKTYSVTNLAVKDAARLYSPAEVVAVSREVESGTPSYISTSYVERQMRSVARMLWPSVRQAMIWICWSRERLFMMGPIRHVEGVGPLERTRRTDYIRCSRSLWGPIPG